MSNVDPTALFPVPSRLIGRHTELEHLHNAIGVERLHNVVFYIIGEGGLGKTRLLRAVLERVRQRRDVLETGILDLSQGRYLQPVLFMRAVVRRLRHCLEQRGDAHAKSCFQDYECQLAEYERFLGDRAELSNINLEQVEQAFLSDYRKLAERFPIVLFIDTFEKLSPVIDEVREFNFRQSRRFEKWLVALLARLPNTTTLLAGRKNSKQAQLLHKGLTQQAKRIPQPRRSSSQRRAGARTRVTRRNRLIKKRLAPFTEQDTSEFVREFAPAHTKNASLLHEFSGGRPVLLAVAVSLAEIARRQGQVWSPPDVRRNEFAATVLTDISNDMPAFKQVLEKAFFLRKGISVDILRQLPDDDPDAAVQDDLAAYANVPIFKVLDIQSRGAQPLLTLHDEFHELLFDYISQRDASTWYRAIIHYLEHQLAVIDAKIALPPDQRPPGTLIALIGERHTLQTELLFYRMAADPAKGYQAYRNSSQTVILARDEDHAMQLQDELARFFDHKTKWGQTYRKRLLDSELSWEDIVCDEAIRWADRRLVAYVPRRERYPDARDMVQRISRKFGAVLERNAPLRLRLAVVDLRARTFLTRTSDEQADLGQQFDARIAALEDMLGRGEAHQMSALEQPDSVKLVLALAYNYRGYFWRLQQRYRSAIADYTRAAGLCKVLGPDVNGLRAQILINLSYAQNEQGNAEDAEHCAEFAHSLAEQLGSRHLMGTALNTLARINRLRNPTRALNDVDKAGRLFDELSSLRSRALCYIAQGLVYSRMAKLSAFKPPDGEEHYQRALHCFEEAFRRLAGATEVLRPIEALIGWADVLRSRGLADQAQGHSPASVFEVAMDKLVQARALCTSATPPPVLIDILGGMAVIELARGHYAQADDLLQTAEQYIPDTYLLKEGEGIISSSETEEMRLYWLRHAQIELQQALYAFKQTLDIAGCLHLQRSFAYLLTFSRDAPQIHTFRRLARQWLLEGRSRGQLNELREETNWFASRYRIERDARMEMERLFDAAIREIDLL